MVSPLQDHELRLEKMEGHRDQTTWAGRISEIGSRYEEPVDSDGDRQQDIVGAGTDQPELGCLMVKMNALGVVLEHLDAQGLMLPAVLPARLRDRRRPS